MNPAELARGLDRRFETLAGGRRRAVQRHQTLRAAIDWSYELLSEPEQRLLARLAVFAGGATRDAVEVVCGGEPIEERRVFELLAGLVDRSLVVAQRDAPQTRYRLLETIREYGEERLAEHSETEARRARHAEYYTDFAGVLSEQVMGPDQLEVGRRLVAEHENLLAAMNFAVDTNDTDLALRLLPSTAPWWQIGYALRFPVEPILSMPDVTEHHLYPYGLAVAANYAAMRGDPVSDALGEQALAAAGRRGSDPVVEMIVAAARTERAYARGAWRDAATQSQREAEFARAAGLPGWTANGLSSAATALAMAGEPDAAVPLATEGLALARQVQMPTLITMGLAALAGALVDRDPERAQALLHESAQLRATLGYEVGMEITQAVLITARLRDWPQILQLAPASIRHLHWNGDRPYLAGLFNIVARAIAPTAAEAAAVLQGAAHRLAITAMSDLEPSSHSPNPPSSRTATPARRPSGTAGLIAEVRRETTGILRETLSEVRLRELRGEGEAMNTDNAVAYALTSIEHAQPSE